MSSHIVGSEGVITKYSRPPYVFSRLSPSLTKIVEYDSYTQFPFLYLIHGKDKLVLLDTGCGTGDLAKFVMSHDLNPHQLPVYVVCSHSHFDHIGGNWQFSGAGGKAAFCAELAFGGGRRKYTEKWRANIFGDQVKDFTITKWLADGETIEMGAEPNNCEDIKVIHTPGHTPDEIALYYAKERRLFVGDSFYQWQPIFIPKDGESLDAFKASVSKLLMLVELEEANDSQAPPIVMCCGHVDDFLPARTALQQVEKLVMGIQDGSLPHIRNTAFGMQLDEYRLDSFSIGFMQDALAENSVCCVSGSGHTHQYPTRT